MAFSHGDTAFDLNTVLVVDDAVQDTFGDGAAFVFAPVTVNAVVPVIYIILGTEDQRVYDTLNLPKKSVRNP